MVVLRHRSATARRRSILRRVALIKKQKRRGSKTTKACSAELEQQAPSAAQPLQLSQQREPLVIPVPEERKEASREAVGLRLVGGNVVVNEDGKALGTKLACSTWEYPVMDEQRRCFAGVLREAVDPSMREKLWDMVFKGTPWEQPMQTWGPMPRKTAWMSEAPCSCNYGYGGMQIKPIPFPDWMVEIMTLLLPLCGLTKREQWPNSCNLNLYENNEHSVSWHSDNEKLFNGKFQDCPIISLSLGQERMFEMKAPALKEGAEKTEFKLPLHSGDLCTMEGMFQKYYDHRVPREDKKKKVGPRINITWRWVVDHVSTCALHTAEKRIMPYGGGKGNPVCTKGGKGKGKDSGKGKDKGKGKGKGKDNATGKGKGAGRGFAGVRH